MNSAVAADNNGRRLGFDRRQFSYTDYVPDRRSNQDRRKGTDRRTKPRIKSILKDQT